MPTDRDGHVADTAANRGGPRRTMAHGSDMEVGPVAPDWPRIEWESHHWRSAVDSSSLPPSVRRSIRNGEYLSAVTHDIERSPIVLSPLLSTLVTDASVEIARFDAEVGHRINHFSAVLLRTESVASSKIENLSASARAIADAELTGVGGGIATMIVANTKAMTAAIDLSDRLDADAILAMHHALLAGSDPEIAGKWRTDQVWIGGGNFGPHEAMFVPPHRDRVQPSIDDLVSFIARDDAPPLAHAAIAHAQFETIHPFPDGNGRTGRALIHAMLRSKGLTRHVSVPISAGLLADTGRYFDALSAYRDGHLEPIVAQICYASYAAVGNGRQLAADLRDVRDGWDSRIKARKDSTAWKVADILVRQPVLNSAILERGLGVSNTNALIALKNLEDLGILTSYRSSKRNRAWRSNEVLQCLDLFAARAGRRNLAP